MHQTQNDNEPVQRINDALVEKIMGWRVTAARYYKSADEYISKRSFDPMRDWCSTLSLIQHARLLDRHLTGSLTFRCDDVGAMTFSASVTRNRDRYNYSSSKRPWAAMALAEALAKAYGIDVYSGAQ
jgi:hypothetical protein